MKKKQKNEDYFQIEIQAYYTYKDGKRTRIELPNPILTDSRYGLPIVRIFFEREQQCESLEYKEIRKLICFCDK